MLLAIILLLLYLLSRYNYLLYHCAVELFSVFVALAIFVVAWNTRAWTTNRYLVFLGVAYLFVALIDTTHTLAYKGMGVLPTHGANEATQLWILARYMEALSLLAAPLFITRRLRTLPLFLLYAAATGFGLLAIWRLGIFPVCFVEGQGLTPFKVISEYVICGLLVGAIAHTLRYRERFASRILSLLVVAMAATVVEELAFTLYTDVYGILNVVGHLLKATSFYLIYRAIVVTGLATPYQLLFDDLISARTAAQRERDTARRYLDVAGVMLVVLDRSGSIVLINRKAAQVLECTEKEVIGLDWFETFLPASQRVSRRDILRRLMAGDAQETRDSAYSQTLVVTTSGAERTISWHDTVVHDTDGTIVGTLSSGEDVTSRLATESALRDSEERFRLLFENTPDAVYVTNVEGTSFQANLAWLNLFGYKAEELSTFRAVDAYESAADRERFLRSMEQQDVLRDEEVRLKKRDGTVMECIRIVAAVRDADGRVIAFQGVIHDVTEQKRAARALLVSENRYRSLFEQSMDAIALTTPDGRVTEANDAWLRLFAYPREALGSLNVLDLYEEPRDRTRFLERISAQGTLVDDEIRLKRRDGSVIDCVTTIVRLRSDDGTLLGFQSVIHDVTDRKKAEAALRKSEEKYRSLFERSLDAVCLVAVDGTLLDANPAYLKLYGYDAGDIGRVNVNDHYQAPSAARNCCACWSRAMWPSTTPLVSGEKTARSWNVSAHR